MNTKTYKYTFDSLKGTFFRAQDSDGNWFKQNAYDATNEQFHAWATKKCKIENSKNCFWGYPDRFYFCKQLFEEGCLVVPIDFLEKDS